MKIYTKTGDQGKTSLFSGERVLKCDPRIEAYGDLDELNSVMGAAAAALPPEQAAIIAEIRQRQAELIHMSAWLATTPGSASARHLAPISAEGQEKLESAIDRMDETLPRLKNFVFPGGHLAGALVHMARTVCRRAERRVIELVAGDEGNSSPQLQAIQVYLNRLSDYLFVLARYCNQAMGSGDILWES